MKIYDRGGVAWTRIDGVRKSLGVPFKDKKAHAAAIQRLLAAPKASVGVTLRHACGEALRLHYRGPSATTQQPSAKADECVEFFGEACKLADLTAQRIAEWKVSLKAKGNSGSTVNRKLAFLSKVLHLAEEWGMLDHLPKIRREQENQGRIRWISYAEEALMWDHWFGSEWQDIFSLLIDTGMRPSELRRVTAQDLDGAVLRVWKQKGKKPRSIPLSNRALAVLQHRIEDTAAQPDALLFDHVKEDRIVHAWDKMRKALGITDPLFVAYTTRHTFAVRMLEVGVDLLTLRDLMGHSKIETTAIYAHVTGGLKRDAVQKVEAARAVSSTVTKTAQSGGQPGSNVVRISLIRKEKDLSPNRNPSVNSPSLYRLSYQGIDLQISGLTAYSTPPKS